MELPHASVLYIVRSFIVWSFIVKVVGSFVYMSGREKKKWFIEENCTTITVIIMSKGRCLRRKSF